MNNDDIQLNQLKNSHNKYNNGVKLNAVANNIDDDSDNDFEDSQYSIFLKSLNNENLIHHINHISQTQSQTQNLTINKSPEFKHPSFQDNSTPKKLPSILTSVSSDPFDDDLDINLIINNSKDKQTEEENKQGEGVINNEDNEDHGDHGDNDDNDPKIIEKKNSPDDEFSDSDSASDKDESAIGKLHEFGDYKTYFDSKHMKQQRQDEAYVKWDKQRRKDQNLDLEPTSIFKNCSIFVNGHTKPSINEIHRLVILHGGKFLSYLPNKSSATHIICDRLTPRKNIMFKNCRVVKAKWIVDCVEANELLDWQKYRIILDVAFDQQRLSFGNTNKESTIDENENEIEKGEANDEVQASESKAVETGLKDDFNSNMVVNFDDEDDEIQSTLLRQEENILEKSQQLELSQNQDQTSDGIDDIPILDKIPSAADKGVHQVKGKFVLDARHPDFLAGFFANSRLHHLSMWKSDLRLKFLKRIIKENLHKTKQTPFYQPNENKDQKKIIMHIDFDCFFATASCLKHPNLDINKDAIVVGHGGKSSDVASCNYVARKFGIRNGMWFKSAQQLCPNLHLLDYEFDSYEKYSGEFYNYLVTSNYFDTIFPVSIDEVLVDATSYCNNAEKSVEEAVDELSSIIRKHIHQLTNCSVSVGVGSNVLLAKIALKKAKPNGQFALFDKIDETLATVPVKDLPGFGKGILIKLEPEFNKSFPIIEDVLPVPRQRLTQILGEKTGTKLYEYSRGIDHTSIEIDTSNPEMVLGRKSISVDVNFGIRFDTVEELDDFFIRISKEMYYRMINLGIVGSTLTLRLAKRREGASIVTAKFLGLGEVDFINKSSRLGVATNDWGVIGNEIKVLYRMVNIPVTDLRGISISITKLKDADLNKSARQMQLPFQKTNKKLPSSALTVASPYRDNDRRTYPRKNSSPSKSTNNYRSSNNNSPIKKQSMKIDEKLIFSKEDIAKRRKKSTSPPSVVDQFGNLDQIDWEMFEILPPDIKRELESELRRRGILPEFKTNNFKGKSYLQQLIPTQGGNTKYVRVRESPTKSPSKRKQTPTPSPIKKPKTEPIYEDSQSYDSSVINQLPSSIKKDVLKEIEYKKKIKKYNLLPMRDKINQKIEQSKVEVELITSDWISTQPKIINLPPFLNFENITTRQLRLKIKQWVTTSLDQQGPHEDDIIYFQIFLQKMIELGQLSRAILLVDYIKELLEYHKLMINFETSSQDQFSDGQNMFFISGIDDWDIQLNTLYKFLEQYNRM
ncbi:REV1 [Candida jiufengensis]|uniref:REV1 n=1 Tax=Candida jiufengensis TaxID=497108 RepID=UPI0022244D19|nr:REV1 [Candida jiufengensis]KAI5955061.1 REV1 [Candida jiufengensis]